MYEIVTNVFSNMIWRDYLFLLFSFFLRDNFLFFAVAIWAEEQWEWELELHAVCRIDCNTSHRQMHWQAQHSLVLWQSVIFTLLLFLFVTLILDARSSPIVTKHSTLCQANQFSAEITSIDKIPESILNKRKWTFCFCCFFFVF